MLYSPLKRNFRKCFSLGVLVGRTGPICSIVSQDFDFAGVQKTLGVVNLFLYFCKCPSKIATKFSANFQELIIFSIKNSMKNSMKLALLLSILYIWNGFYAEASEASCDGKC